MKRRATRFAALPVCAAALGLLAGCGHGVTKYIPQLRAEGELTLRYDDGFSMYAEGRQIAEGQTWAGLSEYVKCVPKAHAHAEAAQTNGAAAVGLSWSGAGIGLASLGSLGGLAVYDEKEPGLALGILGIGVAAAVTGVVLAAIGRHEKNVSNGHAVDAMNYYNDEVGSRGGTCKKPPPKLPEVEAVAPDVVDQLEKERKDTPPPPPPPPPSSDEI